MTGSGRFLPDSTRRSPALAPASGATSGSSASRLKAAVRPGAPARSSPWHRHQQQARPRLLQRVGEEQVARLVEIHRPLDEVRDGGPRPARPAPARAVKTVSASDEARQRHPRNSRTAISVCSPSLSAAAAPPSASRARSLRCAPSRARSVRSPSPEAGAGAGGAGGESEGEAHADRRAGVPPGAAGGPRRWR